jgi:hypothetical protein
VSALAKADTGRSALVADDAKDSRIAGEVERTTIATARQGLCTRIESYELIPRNVEIWVAREGWDRAVDARQLERLAADESVTEASELLPEADRLSSVPPA